MDMEYVPTLKMAFPVSGTFPKRLNSLTYGSKLHLLRAQHLYLLHDFSPAYNLTHIVNEAARVSDSNTFTMSLSEISLCSMFLKNVSFIASDLTDWLTIDIDNYISSKTFQKKLNSQPWYTPECQSMDTETITSIVFNVKLKLIRYGFK